MCIQAPQLPAPSLGGGLSIEPPALPQFSGDLGLCCKTVPYSTPPLPPLFPPGVFNGTVGVALGSAIDAIQTYLDSLPPKCPLE